MRALFIAAALLAASVCDANAATLPNLNLTPGAAVPGLTVAKICATKWGKDVRHVTAAMKAQAFHEYGLTGNKDPFCQPKGCEVDHLISRELGGADDIKNLWPQSYAGPWNAHDKDRLENRLHKEVCAGHLSLEDARKDISQDWTAAYRHYFGLPAGE